MLVPGPLRTAEIYSILFLKWEQWIYTSWSQRSRNVEEIRIKRTKSDLELRENLSFVKTWNGIMLDTLAKFITIYNLLGNFLREIFIFRDIFCGPAVSRQACVWNVPFISFFPPSSKCQLGRFFFSSEIIVISKNILQKKNG